MRIRKRMGLPRQFLHVMNRGARKLTIFTDDEDRRNFVQMMGKFALKHQVPIVAWCLMPNHAHVEPESEGKPLCGMMHDLEGTYARAFNNRHGTSGCVFQGPFVCTKINDARGLAYVSRYIHLNPCALRVSPITYRWSSLRSYLGLAPVPPWLNPDPVLRQFGKDRVSQIRGYRMYLTQAPFRRRRKAIQNPFVDFYVEFMRHLEEGLAEHLIMTHGALGDVTQRSVMAWMARKVHEIPTRVVSDFLGYSSESAVSVAVHRLEKRLRAHPHLRNLLGPR